MPIFRVKSSPRPCDRFRDGLQLLPTMVWWSKRRAGVSMVLSVSSMLFSANREKISAEVYGLRSSLMPGMVPPCWVCVKEVESFMRCWFHSVPSVRFWFTMKSIGRLISLCSITSARSVSVNLLLLNNPSRPPASPSPRRELRVCSYCAQLLVVMPLSQPPFQVTAKF
ncbi:Uncharacterised protein [Enterobacter cloacae]|nr:Uncharacterised protein [Enterobacter cloacae]